MLPNEEELLKKLSIADLERAQAYAKDLGQGLQKLRTFPQGVTVFGSARLPQDNKYCQMAYELGAELAKNGHAVVTGGGPSIMEAANHGSYDYGGRSIGLNITLKHEQHPNPYLSDCITFEYFFARKVMLAMASKVFAFFPGGFGTMDEMTEILCLMQESKMPKMPVFLVGTEFWMDFGRMFEKMMEMKLINPNDGDIVTLTDDINEIVAAANRVGHPKVSENFYDGFREASALEGQQQVPTANETPATNPPVTTDTPTASNASEPTPSEPASTAN